MSKRSTPVKGKRGQPACDDVPGEFCSRFLSLMASFYDNPSTEEILTFPPVKARQWTPKEEQRIEFESPVTDLRLRRRLEAQAGEVAQVENDYAENLQKLSEQFKTSDADMTGVFEAELVERAAIPKYLANERLDQEDNKYQLRKRTWKPMDILAIEKQNTKRLEVALQRGIIRAKKRKERMESAASPRSDLYKSQIGRNQPSPGDLLHKKEAEAALRREVQQAYSPK